ncbi:hypothetical protein SDC9_05975 [bioreactor metagenome]|uniref:Uncharacterized protein n=1 Tax=bioreactor metagenome TaxID=1076179 RepID=A0A644T0P1_9ZZZZ|nr:hypothetical protein [Negativicutes bacterium]
MLRAKCLAKIQENGRIYVKGEYIQLPEERAVKLAQDGKIIGISDEMDTVTIKPVTYKGAFRQPTQGKQLISQTFMFAVSETGA